MKRKVLAGILAGLFVLSTLAGCGSTKTENSAETTEPETTTEAATDDGTEAETSENSADEEKMTLILALRDEWLSELEAGAIAAADEVGVKLTTADAQNDTSKLLQFIETAKNDGQKAVIVNMVDPETAAQCVEAAGDMKVVFVNRIPTVTEGLLNENVVYVGSDENTSGKFQGEWLAEHFKKEGKTEIKYILLNGTIGNVSTTLRTESVLKALEDNGITATEATAPLAADFNRETAQDMIAPLLTTTEYDCIISNNDAMALGAVEALTQEGIDPATVPVVGIDASTDGRQAVKDGTLAMSVFQDPVGQGKGALLAAKNLLEGKPVNDGSEYDVDETGYIVWVPFELVTPENVADYDNR